MINQTKSYQKTYEFLTVRFIQNKQFEKKIKLGFEKKKKTINKTNKKCLVFYM